MNDYLEPYEDMSAYSFAVAEKFVEPITNALCKPWVLFLTEKKNASLFQIIILKVMRNLFFTKAKMMSVRL